MLGNTIAVGATGAHRGARTGGRRRVNRLD